VEICIDVEKRGELGTEDSTPSKQTGVLSGGEVVTGSSRQNNDVGSSFQSLIRSRLTNIPRGTGTPRVPAIQEAAVVPHVLRAG
jgi:hypothetical protein